MTQQVRGSSITVITLWNKVILILAIGFLSSQNLSLFTKQSVVNHDAAIAFPDTRPSVSGIFVNSTTTSTSTATHTPTIEASPVASKFNQTALPAKKILAKWYPESPLENDGNSKLSYYTDIAAAFEGQGEDVIMCQVSLMDCMHMAHQQGMIFAPLIPHYTISTAPLKRLDFQIRKLGTRLDQFLENASTTSGDGSKPCITLVLMYNKVYKRMTEKMKLLLDPFQDKWTTSKINMVATTWSPHADEFTERYGIPFVYIPFGTNVDTFGRSTFQPWKNRSCDVFLRWDTDPTKYELREVISAHNFSTSSRRVIVHEPAHFLGVQEYVKAIEDCKMTVSTIGMPDLYDLLGTRYYEIMASGSTLLLLQRPRSPQAIQAYEESNLVENATYVGFSTVQELRNQVHYYQDHEDDARRIIHAASRAVENHTWQHRARQMVTAIRKHTHCLH